MVNGSSAATSVPTEKVAAELHSILKGYNDGEIMCSKVMAWLRKDESLGEQNCSFEKINNIVEFLQCYPLEVKKNRNASNRMDDILHMRKEDTAKNGGLPPREELDRASKVLMFIWRKMCEQSKNLAQTFKIFDTRDKGKLKKTDFVTGLEKYQIQLSKDDVDAAWEALDVRKCGHITFEEFSKIHKSEKQKYMDDPYLSNQI